MADDNRSEELATESDGYETLSDDEIVIDEDESEDGLTDEQSV